MLSQKIIASPQKHWKYVTHQTLIRIKYIIPRSRRSTNWNNALIVSGPLWVTQLLNVLLALGIKVYALTFMAYILSTRYNKDDVMWHVWLFWETVTASHVIVRRYSVNHSMTLNYCVDGSIWHFKFPKVVQAHTLGEVGILGTVLLRVYSGTTVPNFIEIGSYLTDKEQKISWHSFFETRCIY